MPSKQFQDDRSAEPKLAAVAKAVDMSSTHVESLVSISRDLVSLDSPVGVDRDASTIGDFVADTDYQSPEEQAQDSALKDQINKVLATLTEKEADIIVRRFGLNGKQPLSLKEIGARYRLTKERIRQSPTAAGGSTTERATARCWTSPTEMRCRSSPTWSRSTEARSKGKRRSCTEGPGQVSSARCSESQCM